MSDVQNNEVSTVSTRTSQRLIEKILPPNERNFKNIKEKLPKHQF